MLRIFFVAALIVLFLRVIRRARGSGGWEGAMARYEARDRRHPPAPGTIAFVGSSSFRLWQSLAQDMAPLPVWNRAFGGSATRDQIVALPRLILPHRPAVVVYYCGDNDLADPAADPQVAVRGFQDFVAALRRALPATRVIYVSIKPSPARAAGWERVRQANASVRSWCEADPLLTFVDVTAAMMGAEGRPRRELFWIDRLHMNAAGYRIWTGIIRPEVARVWNEVAAIRT